MGKKIFTVTIINILLLIFVSVLLAGYPDDRPKLFSQTYWNTHRMRLVRLSEKHTDAQNNVTFDLQTIQDYSKGEGGATSLSFETLSQWLSMSEDPSLLTKGALVGLFEPMLPNERGYATVLETAPQDWELGKMVLSIAKFRAKDTSLESIKEGATSTDPFIVEYCLVQLHHHLNEKPNPAFSDTSFVNKLHNYRDDDAHPMQLRMEADDLLASSGHVTPAEQSIWAKHLIETTKTDEWALPFLVSTRFLLSGHEDEQARFLLPFVHNQTIPFSTRQAAIGCLQNYFLFRTKTDPTNAQASEVFDTVLNEMVVGDGQTQQLIANGLAGWLKVDNENLKTGLKTKALTALKKTEAAHGKTHASWLEDEIGEIQKM